MLTIQMICENFLLQMALGLIALTPIASSRLTGAGFIRLSSFLSMGLVILSLLLHLSYASWKSPQAIVLATSILFLFVHGQFHRDQKGPFMWILYALSSFLLLYALTLFHNFDLRVLSYILLSTFLMGSVVYAMVLGHWYLVVPKLSTRPLKISLVFLWIFLGLKLIESTYGLVESWDSFFATTGQIKGFSFNWMRLLMRVGWGYLVLGIMSVFTWKLVRLRSIQSATGMLYAMTFFIFVGELISNYLYFENGIFL